MKYFDVHIFYLSSQSTYLQLFFEGHPVQKFSLLYYYAEQAMEKLNFIKDRVVSSEHILFFHSSNSDDRIKIRKFFSCIEVSQILDLSSRFQNFLEIPVCYDDDFALDKERVMNLTGLSWDECVCRHYQGLYEVISMGFRPGFAYLGTLSESLTTVRQVSPRKLVKAGSVAIVDRQTAIYPTDGVGGWNIIGRTYIKVWDETRTTSSLMTPYTRIRFKKVNRDIFDEYV